MSVDLDAYAARIEYTGTFAPSLDTLRALHFAHATHIPFENLDVLLGRPIRLDVEGLWNKLVEGNRGGYCFEQNSLFEAVLERIGFRVVRLAARVRLDATSIRARTHKLLLIPMDGENWVCDVGFGGEGLLYPVPLRVGEVARQFVWQYRVIVDGPFHVLQCARPEGWADMYAFTLEEQHPIDYELANYYTSTHQNSIFRRTLLVQRPGPDVRLTLLNRRLIERYPDAATETLIPDDEALLRVLAGRFDLEFPQGTRFPYEEAATAAAFSGPQRPAQADR
jgi:N-hydroxyarylamine O-acetyltransferase